MDFNWVIDKEFSWEMGHRVWSQKLQHAHLSLSTDCQCKHLHGHSYTIKVFLGANGLDQSAMVTDFKNLNFMKNFLDDTLDHKFMIDINDPLFEDITNSSIKESVKPFSNFTNLGNILREIDFILGPNELYDSFVLVDFVPTSENICKHIKQYAQDQLGSVANVVALELWETKKSHCRYIG